MGVVKRGRKWCTVHGSPRKKGSKTDKPKGSVIACFPTKKAAMRQHRAISMSKARKKGHRIPKKKGR